jgi:hypothetical protein
VTKLAVPFLPLVVARLVSHVKYSPNIDLWPLILAIMPVRSPSIGNRSELALEQEQLKEELDFRRNKGECGS